MGEREITRSPDELKVMENYLTSEELKELFKEIEAFHGVKINIVDITDEAKENLMKACDPHGYPFPEDIDEE